MATSPVNGTGSTKSITSSTAIQGKGVNEMGMNDFFNLLVAQMTNQDMLNPADNTQMIAQMAQFSALQGMQTIQEYQQSAYAMSYVGKTVAIANVNETTGNIEKITGVVENLTFYDGKPRVVVNGKSYEMHTIMEVTAPDNTGNMLNQVAGYIGKNVTLTDTDEDGEPFDVTGIVTSVTLKGGKPYVLIGDKAYPASDITVVQSASSAAETDSDK